MPERSASSDRSAAEIVAGLSREDKVRLLSGRDFWHLEPLPTEDLPALTITDGPHGLRKQADDHTGSMPATCFPTAAALGATWDPGLLEEIGGALAEECRVQDVAVLLGPGLNIKRHPAGGRNFEYFSEDPLLSGRLAAAMIRGLQAGGVGACVKHFVANNQETFRMTVDAIVDERSLRELYLAGFEIAVREGRPWTVMSSYNRLNGGYVGESHRLLTEVLRDEWGFDGLVMSDWGATDDRVAALRAGLDLEMPGGGGSQDHVVLEAVRSGARTETDVDRAATRVVELMLRSRASDRDASPEADLDAHHALARRAAAAGTVLLTNDGILPLTDPGRLAIVGAFAAQPRYQGAGSSRVTPTRLDTVLETLRSYEGGRIADVRFAIGYDPRTGQTDDRLVADAVAAATAADAAILLIGLPPSYESEGYDRHHLALPAGHIRLVDAVLDANPRTVVVLANGAPVELPWADRPAALLEAYLGGQAGGSALVDVILGDAEPGGRLAESFPVRRTDLPADRHFPGHPRQVEYRERFAVGYRFHDRGIPARFPFGHGLSYTTFSYSEPGAVVDGQDVTVTVDVTNTGPRSGSEVVQVYVRDVEATLDRPDKELRGFVKVHVDPDETATVEVHLGPRAFAFWEDGSGWTVEAGTFEILVAASSTDVRGSVTVELPGVSDVTPEPEHGLVAGRDEFAAVLGRPLPHPDGSRPFHRNSTIADLRQTWLGRRVRALLVRQARHRAAAELAGIAEDVEGYVDATVDQLPLRALVSLSGGALSWGALDVLVAALNGRWSGAARSISRRPST